jgi:hypothetical protein
MPSRIKWLCSVEAGGQRLRISIQIWTLNLRFRCALAMARRSPDPRPDTASASGFAQIPSDQVGGNASPPPLQGVLAHGLTESLLVGF